MLKDMESQMNHFQNLNAVDTMSVGGTPYLQPNMTGPAQMARLFSPSPEPLRPNVTGPADMARMFAPSKDSQTTTTTNNNSNDFNDFITNDNFIIIVLNIILHHCHHNQKFHFLLLQVR